MNLVLSGDIINELKKYFLIGISFFWMHFAVDFLNIILINAFINNRVFELRIFILSDNSTKY